MFTPQGTRTAKIKTYKDHEHCCDSCKDFDMTVKVYQPYFHFFFLPVAPTGTKSVKAHCSKCTQPYRNDHMNRVYEVKTRPPVYLYTLTILIALLIIVGLGMNMINKLILD